MTGREVDEVYADGGVRGFPMFAKYDDVDTGVATLRMADGHARRPDHRPPRSARLRHPGRAVRLGGLGQRRARAADADALRGAGRPAAGGPGLARLPRSLHAAYAAEFVAFIRVARGEVAEPVHGPRRRRRPSASRRPRPARSTSTDRCDSRRSPADERPGRFRQRKEVARSRDGIGIPSATRGVRRIGDERSRIGRVTLERRARRRHT